MRRFKSVGICLLFTMTFANSTSLQKNDSDNDDAICTGGSPKLASGLSVLQNTQAQLRVPVLRDPEDAVSESCEGNETTQQCRPPTASSFLLTDDGCMVARGAIECNKNNRCACKSGYCLKSGIEFAMGIVPLFNFKVCAPMSTTIINATVGEEQVQCKFPFHYKGMTFNSCTGFLAFKPWCCIDTNCGQWGYCVMRTKGGKGRSEPGPAPRPSPAPPVPPTLVPPTPLPPSRPATPEPTASDCSCIEYTLSDLTRNPWYNGQWRKMPDLCSNGKPVYKKQDRFLNFDSGEDRWEFSHAPCQTSTNWFPGETSQECPISVQGGGSWKCTHCTTDSDCLQGWPSGTVCLRNECVAPTLIPTDVPTELPTPQPAEGSCTSDGDCNFGEYCASGKQCVEYESDYCHSAVCGIGDGDCDNDGQCSGDLMCGNNNCQSFHSLNHIDSTGADCCYQPWIDATSGRVTAPFVQRAGGYAEIPEGLGHRGAVLEFDVTCTGSGNDEFEAEVIAPNRWSNSFRLQVDNGDVSDWHFPDASSWYWSPKSPERWMTPGHHTVKLHGREDGVKIRSFRFEGGISNANCQWQQAGTYVKMPINQECYPGAQITDRDACEEAAAELGLAWGYCCNHNNQERYGCTNRAYDFDVVFNPNTGATPTVSDNRVAICQRQP